MVSTSFVLGRWAGVRFDTTGSAARAVVKALRIARAAVNRWRVVMGEGLLERFAAQLN